MTTPSPSPYDPAQQSAQPIPPQPEPTSATATIPTDTAAHPSWWRPAAAGLAVGALLGASITFGAMKAIGTDDATPSTSPATPVPTAVADTRLADAVTACALQNTTGIDLADGDQTITIDSRGEDDYSGAGFEDAFCLFDELETPTATLSHIRQTTSMDGRQTESWNGVTFSWSYHPDRGLDGVLTLD